MPISQQDLARLSRTSLNDYLRNTPVDQITQERPLLNKLLQGKKPFGGALQYVKENIRKSHDSAFTWTYGEAQINFAKRDTVTQTEFPWKHCVDSLYRSDDELFSNGIRVVRGDNGKVSLEKNEKVQLIDMLEEDNQVLREGFMESLDFECHRDGTSSNDAIVGLDGLISLTPTTGTVGGIDRSVAANKYWRNYADATLAQSDMLEKMERAWRECTRCAGGSTPDFILAGWDFIEAYNKAIPVTRNMDAGSVGRKDGGIGEGTNTGLFFKGKPVIWDPTFDRLDSTDSPSTAWSKRCYFLNTKDIKWREDGYDIFSPATPHNTLCLFTVVSLRCVLSMRRANSHAVLALA